MRNPATTLVLAGWLVMLAGCAAATAPEPQYRECGPQERLVCTGRKATKLPIPADEMEFCRCEALR